MGDEPKTLWNWLVKHLPPGAVAMMKWLRNNYLSRPRLIVCGKCGKRFWYTGLYWIEDAFCSEVCRGEDGPE